MRKDPGGYRKWHRIVCVLLVIGSLLLSGCTSMPGSQGQTQPSETTKATEAPGATQNPQADTTNPTASAPDNASLVIFRQTMVETPQLFAAAYLGYPENIDQEAQADPYALMQENACWLCEDLPFLQQIPQERIVGETGELYCIVPRDENATIAVNRGIWDAESGMCEYTDVIYRSESGDPILLFCNGGGWEPDTQVVITDSDGTQVVWYPQLDDNRCAMPLRNDDWEDLFFDFSPYREIIMAKHRQLKDTQWGMPTAEMLEGTTWVLDGFLKDGRVTSYQVAFEEYVLSVRWNDGIDEEDHEYLYAPWELTYDEGFAILSIDFGEFAGVLRYNLLYHDFYELLYVAMDAVQEDMPIGWEPLYRYLMKPATPEPTEMIGTWELAWTEVEGDRSEAEPGACIIEIRSAASAGLLMSYTSRDFPEDNFQNELLTIDMRQMYTLCGNDEWVADLDYVGPWDTTYTVTLTTDDLLIKQNYFLMDGAPSVSYEYFYRVAE